MSFYENEFDLMHQRYQALENKVRILSARIEECEKELESKRKNRKVQNLPVKERLIKYQEILDCIAEYVCESYGVTMAQYKKNIQRRSTSPVNWPELRAVVFKTANQVFGVSDIYIGHVTRKERSGVNYVINRYQMKTIEGKFTLNATIDHFTNEQKKSA